MSETLLSSTPEAFRPLFDQSELETMQIVDSPPEGSKLIEDQVFADDLGSLVDVYLTFNNEYIRKLTPYGEQ